MLTISHLAVTLEISFRTRAWKMNMAIATSSAGPVLDANISIERCSSTADCVSATTPLESQIRVVPPSEYKAAAYSLAEAFADDHVIRYPIDTPDRMHWTEKERFDLHRQALEYITYAHCVKGLVTTVGDDYAGVALWMPPGKNMDDWFTILRSGMWRLTFQLSSEGKKRFFDEFLPLMHTTKEEVMGKRTLTVGISYTSERSRLVEERDMPENS